MHRNEREQGPARAHRSSGRHEIRAPRIAGRSDHARAVARGTIPNFRQRCRRADSLRDCAAGRRLQIPPGRARMQAQVHPAANKDNDLHCAADENSGGSRLTNRICPGFSDFCGILGSLPVHRRPQGGRIR